MNPLASDVASIAREKVALTAVVRETPVEPAAGDFAVTVGGVFEATVVNVHVTGFASGVAFTSVMLDESRAV